jgi:hypothetical protein
MSKDDFYSEEEMAEMLRISKPTLQSRRSRGQNHPPFKKIGKVVLYPKKSFVAWVDQFQTHEQIQSA